MKFRETNQNLFFQYWLLMIFSSIIYTLRVVHQRKNQTLTLPLFSHSISGYQSLITISTPTNPNSQNLASIDWDWRLNVGQTL